MNKIYRLYLLGFIMGSAIGIMLPIASVHLEARGLSEWLIGVVTSLFFVAMIVGANVFLHIVGKIAAFKIIPCMLIISSVSTIIFAYTDILIIKSISIFIIGMGVSFNYVTVQSCLNQSPAENKAIITGTYSFMYAIGFAVSVVVGTYLFEILKDRVFIIPAVLLLIDAFCVNKFKLELKNEQNGRIRLKFVKISTLISGGFLYGFIENAFTSLYPVFLLSYVSVQQSGILLSAFAVGGIIGLIPLAKLSTKMGMYKSLILYSILSIICMLGMMLTDMRMIFSVLGGGLVCAIYPITLAGLNKAKLDQNQIVKATSYYSMAYSLGCACGPLLGGVAMGLLGSFGLFYISLFILLIFGCSCAAQLLKERQGG